MDSDEITFLVGDSDIRLLGIAAALAARYEARRKGGKVRGLPGYPASDSHALDLLREGLEVGASIPPDDVPRLKVGLYLTREVIAQLRELDHSIDPGPG